jgi:hypothetical protein
MIVKWRDKNYTFTPRTLIAEKDKEGSGAKVTIDAPIFGFDTESVSLPDRYEPQCFQVSSSFDGENLVYLPPKTRGLEYFIEWFVRKYTWLLTESHYIFMYGHNLLYDWLQLIKYYPDLIAVARTGIGLPSDYDIYKTSDYTVTLKKSGLFTGTAPHFTIKVKFSKREWFEIMFRDTFSFFPAPLHKLGKDLKLTTEKKERAEDLGKVDYREMEPCEKKSEFEEYAKVDAKVTRLAGEAIRELHIHAGMKRIRVSAPGFAINYLFHIIPEGTELVTGTFDLSIMQLILDTYAGGSTGGIYHGSVVNMAVLDFHSSYPASMVTLPSFLPTMEYIRYPEPENLSEEELLEILRECHCFVRLSGTETDQRYPSLVTSIKGKLTPVYGEFENIATTGVELCVGISSGTLKVKTIHELVLLVEMEPPKLLPFKIFAEGAYKDKEEAEKGSTQYTSAKLRCNSSYGKLIESRTETPVGDDVGNIVLPYIEGMETKFAELYYKQYIETLNEESTESFEQMVPDIIDGIFEEFGEENLKMSTFKSLSLTDLKYGRYAIPAAASLTTGTSRARLCVAKKALSAWYWDTDSVFIHDLVIEEANKKLAAASEWLPPFIQPICIGDKLGDMDVEIEEASGYLAGTKRYYIDNDIHRNCKDRTKCGDCPQKKKCKYKKALHGIPTAPFDQAETMIQLLATGSNNKYTGKERPLGVKETKDVREIGRFKARDFESQFHLDNRLEWVKDSDGWIGTVKQINRQGVKECQILNT